MLDFLNMARAIQVLYQHIRTKLAEDDFWPLTKDQYSKLSPEERTRSWFMINPSKIRSNEEAIWILDSNEKDTMLQAVNFIERSTRELPTNSSFPERLLYAKQMLPPVLFTRKE